MSEWEKYNISYYVDYKARGGKISNETNCIKQLCILINKKISERYLSSTYGVIFYLVVGYICCEKCTSTLVDNLEKKVLKILKVVFTYENDSTAIKNSFVVSRNHGKDLLFRRVHVKLNLHL